NLDVEEQIAQVRTEIARMSTETSRLVGELGVQREAITDSEWQLARRRREFQDMEGERQQILARLSGGPAVFVPASYPALKAVAFPPALAALEADASRLQSRLIEAEGQQDRARKLAKEGLLARSEMESAEAKTAALSADLKAARERLRAALAEHE